MLNFNLKTPNFIIKWPAICSNDILVSLENRVSRFGKFSNVGRAFHPLSFEMDQSRIVWHQLKNHFVIRIFLPF